MPTHNRPHFLRRLFRFYEQVKPGFPFFVVDSSDPPQAQQNRLVIKEVGRSQRSLQIEYQHFDLDLVNKCARALSRLSSPHVVLCADDDFLIPDTVQVCSRFLQDHPDYSTAQGLTTIARHAGTHVTQRLTTSYAIRHDDALSRCRRLASCWFSNFYAVSRTHDLAEMFQLTAAHFDWSRSFIFPEQFLSQMSVLRGKVHVHPVVSSVWQRHPDNTSLGPKVADRSCVHTLYSEFRDHLVAEMTPRGVDRATAVAFVDRAFIELCETDEVVRKKQQTTFRRMQRFLHRTSRQVRNVLLHEGVVRPRALRPCDTQVVSRDFELAIQMIARYPDGIEHLTKNASAA